MMHRAKDYRIGKPQLVWEDSKQALKTAYVEQKAKPIWNRESMGTIKELFATVRLGSVCGLFAEARKFIVTRNSFDEIREFDDLQSAIAYVESLMALERDTH